MIPLKQSTASQEIPLGYFVDETNGNTEETGLTIANTDIKLWKNGATTLADKNSGGATHISNGIYYAVLDATDTNTLGPLVVFCHVTGALPVRVECCVYAANVYDSLIGASDYLQIEAVAMGASLDVYQAKVTLTDDNSGANDRYVAVWHKNGTPVTAGITNAKIQVIKIADGTDLVAEASMTQIASTGLYRYDEASNRVVSGAGYIAKCTATIDAATRTWYQPVSRDS